MKKPRIAAIDIGTNSIRCIISDGLDRRRNGLVHGVSCQFSGIIATISLTATEDIAVEIFGADSKKDLFEKAFGSEVVFTTSC
ncbi:MAG: hypothetical protein PHY09_03205 [Desulfuromonadaceae bacterium]|nr:hypothetical protein [Desulfuromonadaceae bacterium]MDD5104502.1 hypothetical protein [Desulfuromonadaceae bacterium]